VMRSLAFILRGHPDLALWIAKHITEGTLHSVDVAGHQVRISPLIRGLQTLVAGLPLCDPGEPPRMLT
jgi:hypothetical protein